MVHHMAAISLAASSVPACFATELHDRQHAKCNTQSMIWHDTVLHLIGSTTQCCTRHRAMTEQQHALAHSMRYGTKI